jgi:tRNA(fMet)-specific endonuclease VapC
MYLLDTNICVHFMKGEYNIPSKIKEVGFQNCYISEITILEIMYGVANSSSAKMNENYIRLAEFEASFFDRIISIRHAFKTFAGEKARLRKLGTPISDFDLLIGCSALVQRLTLASRNVKEMSRIEGLVVENWIM